MLSPALVQPVGHEANTALAINYNIYIIQLCTIRRALIIQPAAWTLGQPCRDLYIEPPINLFQVDYHRAGSVYSAIDHVRLRDVGRVRKLWP